VPPYLSDEWIEALDAAARADDELQAAATEADLVVQQVVVDDEGAEVAAWYVVLTADEVAVRSGRTDDFTVRFTQSRATAEAIALGERAALQAFIDGEVRIGGDVNALATRHRALARLGDVFATVRTDP
jgi:hypothetical protein